MRLCDVVQLCSCNYPIGLQLRLCDADAIMSALPIVPYRLASVVHEGNYKSPPNGVVAEKNWIVRKFLQQNLMQVFVDGG